MPKLNPSGSFLVCNSPGHGGTETLAAVSAFREDGTPWIDWTGPRQIPLLFLAHIPQNDGFAVFEVVPTGGLGRRHPVRAPNHPRDRHRIGKFPWTVPGLCLSPSTKRVPVSAWPRRQMADWRRCWPSSVASIAETAPLTPWMPA